MNESILTSIKKLLGIGADYTAFDTDIIIFINSALATLTQIGVGPSSGYMINDATPTWGNFLLNEIELNPAQAYVFIRVKLLFDPPTNAALIEAFEAQKLEAEWRLEVTANPAAPVPVPDDAVLDGGAP